MMRMGKAVTSIGEPTGAMISIAAQMPSLAKWKCSGRRSHARWPEPGGPDESVVCRRHAPQER
jgi:hypothetical protein